MHRNNTGIRISLAARFPREINGRGERIRTSGPCLPKTVLYQAELLPDGAPSNVPWGRVGPAGQAGAL